MNVHCNEDETGRGKGMNSEKKRALKNEKIMMLLLGIVY